MTDFEMAEAERFAQALEAIEALAEPDLDPREDPTLFSLAALAAEIHDAEQAATQMSSFKSYCERSRTYVLNRLGARQAAQRVDDRAARDDGQPFFIFRWNVLAPIASAAASAVLVLAFVVMQSDGTPAQTVAAVAPAVEQPAPDQVTIPAPRAEEAEPARAAEVPVQPEPATRTVVAEAPRLGDLVGEELDFFERFTGGGTVGPTVPPPVDLGPLIPGDEEHYAARMIQLEIERIDLLIAVIAYNVYEDQPVDPEMLREFTESIALVAERLEAQPDVASKQQVISYLTATAHGRTLLAAARSDDENGRALSAARRATQDGVVVASHYIREHY